MPSAKVTLNGTTLAESKETILVEGNQYFPPSAIDKSYFKPSDTHTICSWKGTASYYNIEADGKVITDAAWYYPEPKDAAANIKGYVAFYKNKVVVEVSSANW